MSDPVITVVIPTYQNRTVLPRAIDSVLKQSMSLFELIVVDDGSTDGTDDLLDAYGDPRLRVIRQDNAGVCAARNAGISASTCDFITWLDSDDEAADGWLQFFADARSAGFQLASCAMYFCGPGTERRVVAPEASDGAFGSIRARFLAGALGVDSELLKSVGSFRGGLRFAEHTDLALRLGGRMIEHPFRTTSIDTPLATSHRGPTHYDPVVQFESSMTLLREDAVHLRRSSTMFAEYAAIAGRAASVLGDHATARRMFKQAIGANPRSPKHLARYCRELLLRQ